MKAIIWTKYGPPETLKIEEVEKPTPKDKQVLIKVVASSMNAADYRGLGNPLLSRLMGGSLLKPKPANTRTGRDVSGVVEAVGENVARFKPGDEVFGIAYGAYAEYVLGRETNLAKKPANISHIDAAATPVAALTALQAIRWAGGIKPGQKVLVQGASGGVGIFSVQLAKAYGGEVTATCSPRNLEMVRGLGADHVIDYTKEDITKSGQAFDLILANNGYHSIYAYRRLLTPQGVYACAGGTFPQIIQAFALGPRLSKEGGKRLGNMGIAKPNQEDTETLGELLGAGKIRPVIDRTYPLEQVPQAVRYMLEKHAQGKVAISVG